MKTRINFIIMIFLFFLVFVPFVTCDRDSLLITEPGPRYPPTEGEVWPMPQLETKLTYYYVFIPVKYEIKVTNKKCQILVSAIERFMKTLINLDNIVTRTRGRKNVNEDENRQGPIRQLLINLTAPCEDYPYFKMDERYTVEISASSHLTSNSIWGMLAGLETIAQLFYLSDDYNEIRINATSIVDFPSYPHRGLLLDTARHYISVDNILKILDAMAMNKMNVFHWHIVDDESFPYQSMELPELSEQGAFYPEMVYTRSQIKLIIQYARDRGIRVLPEFDVPGHTRSWGVAYPNILTKCYSKKTVVGLGPLHPLKNATFKVLQTLYNEIQNLFPDKYLHVGGDEVEFECWASNPSIQRFMKLKNITDVKQMHAVFMKRVYELVDPSLTLIVWQEAFDNNPNLQKKAIVQVWKNKWAEEMSRLVYQNQSVILSAPWYLDYLNNQFVDMYSMAPREWVQSVPPDRLKYVVGAEACMWSEMVDDTNVLSRIWPRASAMAELVWFGRRADDSGYHDGVSSRTLSRIEEQACRMRRRGVPAQPPAGPGFCVI